MMDTSLHSPSTRDLIIDTPTCTACVSINTTDTLLQVREKVLQELDDDMLPINNFSFELLPHRIRVGRKQEGIKRAWDYERVGIVESGTIGSKRQRVEEATTLSVLQYPQPVAENPVNSIERVSLSFKTPPRVMKEVSKSNEDLHKTAAVPPTVALASTTKSRSSQDSWKGASQEQEQSESSKDPTPKEASSSSVLDTTRITTSESGSATVSASSEKTAAHVGDESAPLRDDVDEPVTMVDDGGGNDDDDDGHREKSVARRSKEEMAVNEEHSTFQAVIDKSSSNLKSLEALLQRNPLFCSAQRRADLSEELREQLSQTAPNTTIGVLGHTGVGKSSLLNALLNEASILPTSGSRGCTAAVVELRFQPAIENTAMYHGCVEFIALKEWYDELKVLMAECSTLDEKKIYARVPDQDSQSDAAAAWTKIDQVYGAGTMARYHGFPMDRVYNILANDQRVSALLTARDGEAHATKVVQQGSRIQTSSNKRQNLRQRKQWASSFRSKINDYVYRKGNGSQPQTWPLIRKVVLHGPWAVLQSGACLVDLPGVRDANAARARVAANYLQHCQYLWIVAPIQRAVDDGTAKELLGEQFKRRLLMDGQYGNVSFVCTQTDDCETTEILRDHEDVAREKAGRWERLSTERDAIIHKELEYSEMTQEEETLKEELNDTEESLKEVQEELNTLLKEKEGDGVYIDEDSDENHQDMRAVEMYNAIARWNRQKLTASDKLNTWRLKHGAKLSSLCKEINEKQKNLKADCALVRNEYSTGCLQKDFRAGLKELIRSNEEDNERSGEGRAISTAPPIPDDYEMDVFCISANDYLKLEKIKPSSDGPPSTFSNAVDTQIPALRSFVHDLTSRNRVQFAKTFVSNTNDMIDRFKLIALNSSGSLPGGRSARRCESAFQQEMHTFRNELDTVAKEFEQTMHSTTMESLAPSIRRGSEKGKDTALHTVRSWGSKSRRTRHERTPQNNGLYYATYFATVRRSGVYNSTAAGEVDMNQELCDPIEKEFSNDWQRAMDTSIISFLRAAEAKALLCCKKMYQSITAAFLGIGYNNDQIKQIINTASRTGDAHVRAAFASIQNNAREEQRNLNRSLLPLIKQRMERSYHATANAPGGPGKFDRMKNVMQSFSQVAVQTMFDETTTLMLKDVASLIRTLTRMVNNIAGSLSKLLHGIFSVCWDDQSDNENIAPGMKEKVRQCRDGLIPEIDSLRTNQHEVMEQAGVEVEDPELDVTAVANLESRLDEQLKKAEKAGMVIDLCESDEEPDLSIMPPAKKLDASSTRVKLEPGVKTLPVVATRVTPQSAMRNRNGEPQGFPSMI